MQRKSIFDAIRRVLGRGLRQHEVVAIDAAIDTAERGAGFLPRDRVTPGPGLAVSPRGVALIKRFEGCARVRPDGLVEAYPDPGTGGPPWTIGWGATGSGIGPDTIWTQEQCDARLVADIARHAEEVARAIGDSPTSQAQFDALVSFHYNTGAIFRATLTKRHKAGDVSGAAGEFGRWVRAGGRVLNGLVRRRKEEMALYCSSDAE